MKLRLFLALVLGAVLFTGCDEEFEVFAPYKQVPVVFGVINSADTTHYIKFNRSFRGEGNNIEVATIADSTAIEISNPQVEFLNTSGSVVKTTALSKDTLEPREPGDFYTSPNVVYTFEEANVQNFVSARLSFEFNGEKLTAFTPLLDDIQVLQPTRGADIRLVSNDVSTGATADYTSRAVRFRPDGNGIEYRSEFVLRYREFYVDGTSQDKSFSSTISSVIFQSVANVGEVRGELDGENFLARLGTNVDIDPNVNNRLIVSASFVFSGISEDLYIYRQSTDNSIGLGQEIVTFSNVFYEDGTQALGVFGGATSLVRTEEFDGNSLIAIIAGEYTLERGFCSDRPSIALSYPQGACD